MSDVRAVSTVPIVADFGSTKNTPICVDIVTAKAYILNSAGAVQQIGTTTSGGNHWGGGVDTTEDLIVDNSDAGLVLKSPDGHYWRFQVNNSGALVTTDLGLTKP